MDEWAPTLQKSFKNITNHSIWELTRAPLGYSAERAPLGGGADSAPPA